MLYEVITIVLAWLVLVGLFPAQTQQIRLEIKGRFLTNPKALLVYLTFAVTVLLWMSYNFV